MWKTINNHTNNISYGVTHEKQMKKPFSKENILQGLNQQPQRQNRSISTNRLHEVCRVTVCSPSPEEWGYEPNEPNIINL